MIKTLKRWVNHHTNRQIGTYMDRWYLIPPAWNLPICVRLQHIKRADAERIPHNHPYAFKSVVLKGWYVEDQVHDFTELAPGSGQKVFDVRAIHHTPFKVFQIAQEKYHRLVNMSEGGVWTLIWHPRKAKESAWGYLDEDGTHIPHDEYVRPPGYDLPYKTNAYRRDGPTGTQGPGGPGHADEPGKVGEQGQPGNQTLRTRIFTEEDHYLVANVKLGGEVLDTAIYNPKAVQKGDLPK